MVIPKLLLIMVNINDYYMVNDHESYMVYQ